ncbi:cytidine deaminase [[Candida] anglica]|uniref:Cytidine deaminase n=1 Tax=[Candida] anglica TaxID=148631 RepID=A0ABP0E713_9ASCO
MNQRLEIEEISEELLDSLKQKSLEARNLSYNIYSKFAVGCALLTESGDVFVGANVENASYPACICAERVAIVQALMKGHKKFRAIVVSSSGEDVVSPCGVCRQFIFEFGPDTSVYMLGNEGKKTIKYTISELLPLGFGPSHLGK